MRKSFAVLIILTLTFGVAADSYGNVSSAAVLFLRIAAGARAAGIGEAFVAVADDATTTHWNPAGLGTYPLSSKWFEIKVPEYLQPIKKMAILKNESFKEDYKSYDIWALSKLGLVKFNFELGEKLAGNTASASSRYGMGAAMSQTNVYEGALVSSRDKMTLGEIVEPKADQNIESVLRQSMGLAGEIEPERLQYLIEKLAIANNQRPREYLDSLKEQVMSRLTEVNKARGDIDSAFSELQSAYNQCLIDWNGLDKAADLSRDGLKDSVLNESEADRILFALQKSKRKILPSEIIVPYEINFEGAINDIAADDDYLWVAAESGLYRLKGQRWQRLSVNEGLPTNNIRQVKIYGKKAFLATDIGLVVYEAGAFTYYNQTFGLPEKPIQAMTAGDNNKAWVMIDGDFYFFNGTYWKNYYEYNDVLGESDSSFYDRMKIFGTPEEREAYIVKFVERNMLGAPVKMPPHEGAKTDSAAAADTLKAAPKEQPPVGRMVLVPFTAGINYRITDMEADSKGNVWIGTEFGLLRFDGREWRRYGYRHYIPEKDMAVIDLALERLKGDTLRAERLAENIRQVNLLASDTIKAGQKIQLYANPAGAEINQIRPFEGKIFFTTSSGTIVYDGAWSRYNAEGLGARSTNSIAERGNNMWFAAGDRVLIKAGGKREITMMHVNWLPELASDIYYEFFSYVQSVEGWGTVGGNVTFLSYGNITRTDESGRDLGDFSAFDIALTLSYGTALSPSLSGGLSARVIYSHLSSIGAGKEKGSGTSTGLALDVGLLYKLHPRLNLGVAVTNLGPDISYIDVSQADPLPRNLAVGFAWKLLESSYNRALITIEANKSLVGMSDGFSEEVKEVVLNGGAEYWYGSFIAFRGGYIYDQEGEIKTPTLGFGLAYRLFRFDFAYIPSNDQVPLANTMRFALTINM